MIFDLSIRISTLEVDTEIFTNEGNTDGIVVSSDTITTYADGKALVS
jgi:hypothetical protein